MYLLKGRKGLLKKEIFIAMNKLINFFSEVKSELAKVIWPSRSLTIKYTIIVIVFSLSIALFLGAADYGLLKIFEKLVSR